MAKKLRIPASWKFLFSLVSNQQKKTAIYTQASDIALIVTLKGMQNEHSESGYAP